MDQGNRSKIVFIAIGSFFLLFVLFLVLLHQEIQGASLPGPALSSVPTQNALAAVTFTPFQPVTETLVPATSTPAATATSTVTPTATVTATPEPFRVTPPESEATQYPLYIVRPGDRLESVAQQAGISPETIRSANFMYGDAITPGQALIIPPDDSIPAPQWRFASLDKDQGDAFYPVFFGTSQYRMHYMPKTYPSVDPMAVAGVLDRGLAFVEDTFGKPVEFIFDVYVVGTLFEQPNTYLLGRSFSLDRKVYILYNGAGDAVNQQYLATHELTHLYAWNTFGQPVSFLVSEGAAVYTGMKMIADSQYMPINTFCAVYKKEGRLPILAEKTELGDFRGHNNNLVNYYASGCFVGWLVETYGSEKFGQVYSTNDYLGVYGKPLEQLEIEWKSAIPGDGAVSEIDTRRFVTAVDTFMSANEGFFGYFYGSQESIQAYQALDKARLTLLAGDLDAFDAHIANFQILRGQ